MKQKINSILLFIVVVLVLGGVLLPLEQAHAAGLADLISEGIKKLVVGSIDIFSIPLALILMLIQVVTGILPFIAAEIMKVSIVMNETIPLIPSGAQDMVSIGWQFTRDMANMFFILILAWVGFATILRLKTYEVKEILPKLVIIALLINFIPVIAGIILDISNIVTHYFAQRSSGAGEWLVGRLPMNDIVRGGWGNIRPGEGGIAGMAVKSLMGIIFNLIAFFMLTLYALLFIFRIVAIWILLVLAPLAWLGYIIPNGKKVWDMWWKQFIQWSIIGIPLTFFLFLSGLVLGQGMACEPQQINLDQYGFGTGVLAGIGGELLCSILPFAAGIAVLLIGFLLSITLAPSGADTVIKSAKKGGLAASKVLGTQAWKGAKEYAKFPAKAVRDYQTSRTMGLSRREALGAAAFRPARFWRQWRPAIPTVPVRTYRTARGLGFSRIESLKTSIRRWRDWEPAGVRTRGVVNGFKSAIKAGWGAGTGVKGKKRGFKTCPTCGNQKVAAGATECKRCGHVF